MWTIERTLEWECEHADLDTADHFICCSPHQCPHLRYCKEGTVIYEEVDIDVDYEPFVPGRYSGPPENCYPDEGPCISINHVWFEGRDILNDLPGEALNEDSLLEEIAQDAAEAEAEHCKEAM